MAKRVNIPESDYLKGLGEIEINLSNVVSGMKSASSKGLADASLFIAGEAQKRAPVETGDLRSSAHVELDGKSFAKGNKDGSGMDISGAVSNEITHAKIGFYLPYAANQHEHTEYDHPRGGQAKYLESVLVEHQDRILSAIAGKIIGAVFGGGSDDD